MNALHALFNPKSIAVIGASSKPLRAGSVVIKNLLQGDFSGTVLPVNPNYSSVHGVFCYRSISELPLAPDIAILCTHAKRSPALVKELSVKSVKFLIILSTDMYGENENGQSFISECSAICKQNGIRILGPNSLGMILPWINFNASFSPVGANRGKIAFISQSAAVCTTVLDWASDKSIGFSAFISLGNALDIDVPELLDYFATDRHTEAILLYIDDVKHARRFMSAARAASRNRRILVLKGGRTIEGRRVALAHTGAIETLDSIYDSAIKRSGMLRVSNTHELFAAVETLTHSVPLRGERLAIITNGGGPAIMATDTLLDKGGQLAKLSDDVTDKLSQVLPPSWSQQNPVDLVGDAGFQRYVDALNITLDSDDADAILLLHSPSAVALSEQTAQAVISTIQSHPRASHFNILTNWSGEKTPKQARSLFYSAGIPTYRTAESAVTAFMHLVEYRRNQRQLKETPKTSEVVSKTAIAKAQSWLNEATPTSQCHFDTHELTGLFEQFGLDVVPTWIVENGAEAIAVAEQVGYPVVLKLNSPDITHKSDVHGVVVNLRSSDEVQHAADAIYERVQESFPHARLNGLSVQRMANASGADEIRVKVITDATFGPVILIGQGGSEWRINYDAEAVLPPLNMSLARYALISAIKARKLRFQRQLDGVDIQAISAFLVKISQLIIHCPQILELDIHPLLVNGADLTILDADLTLVQGNSKRPVKMAIKPYPSELEQHITLRDGAQILLRPILPEDEPEHAAFIKRVSKEDLYKRFFTDVGEFNHDSLANLTQIDFDREMAFVAVGVDDKIIGVSRALISPDNDDAEFAILVQSDLKGCGLGRVLMENLIDYCRSKNTRMMSGMTMPTNQGMLRLAQKLGFEIDVSFEDGTADMRLVLS